MFITLLDFQANSVACFYLEPSFFNLSFFSRLNREIVDEVVMIFVDLAGFGTSVPSSIIVEGHP